MQNSRIQQTKNIKRTDLKNRSSKREGFNFSFLTIVLIVCIIELLFGSIQNINKSISFKSKIKGLENKRNEELTRNKQLKSEVKNFDSDMTLEAIARNNLKMAGEDEVLIIINKPREIPEQNTKNINHKKNKQIKNRPERRN